MNISRRSLMLGVGASAIVASLPAAASPTQWVQVTSAAQWSPRDSSELFELNGWFYLSNGYYYGGVHHRDLWKTQDCVNWQQVSGSTPYDGYSCMAVLNGEIYAVRNSVWKSSDAVTWTKILNQVPFSPGMIATHLFGHDNKLWFFADDSVWTSVDGVNWIAVDSAPPYAPRRDHRVALLDGRFYIVGGADNQARQPTPEQHLPGRTTMRDVWSTADGSTWTRETTAAPWDPTYWPGVVANDGNIVLVAGLRNTDATLHKHTFISADGKSWTQIAQGAGFASRLYPNIGVFNGEVYMMGGQSAIGANGFVNDVWKLV